MDDSGRSEVPGAPAERPLSPPRATPRELGGAWNVPDSGPEEPQESGRTLGALVSFHYLRSAVRRRWLRSLAFGFVGLLLAAGYLATAAPTATTALLLNRVAKNDGSSPMATDLSLLTNRAVAARTIQALGLTMTPDDLLGSVHPVTTDAPDVLKLTMTGPTTAEAVRRLNQFTSDYLDFRTAQVLAQSTALVQGYERRIADLQSQVDVLNNRIQQLGGGGASSTDLADALASRSNLNGQISTLQGQKQDVSLQVNAIQYASRVIDPPAPVPTGGRRHILLVLVTGLIAGSAVGLGITVLQALLSDRLWLREEVGEALGSTVPLSVRRLAPPRWRWLRIFSFLPWLRSRRSRQAADLQLMSRAIVRALPEPGRRQALAVLCLGNSDQMRFAVVAAADELRRSGTAGTVIDLTVSGRVQAAARRLTGKRPEERPEVFRPSVVPSLTRGPADLETADWDDVAVAKAKNGAVLVIADFDPAVGVDHLSAWSDHVIVAVSAGRSSVELVRTTAALVRVAGLHLVHAVLLRTRPEDISSGFTTASPPSAFENWSMPRLDADGGPGRSYGP